MTSDLERWMDDYLVAWDSNAPSDVDRLFTEDAAHRPSPSSSPSVGREAIRAFWSRTADDAGDHRFSWSRLGSDGARHFVQGRTDYADGRAYDNLWVLDLAPDGRAASFTEWFMTPEG